MSSTTLTQRENGTGMARGRISKVDQYGWSVKDQLGEFKMIPKMALHIDRAYQRDLRPKRVADFRGEWSWIKCGCLTVVQRNDGRYFVVDGQHRLEAVLDRGDIQSLPCLVFQIDETKQEAEAFLGTNCHRGPVKALEKFNAQIISGNLIAKAVNEMVERDGYTIRPAANSDFTVACVQTLMDEMERCADTMRKVWSLCVEMYAGKTPKDRVISGLCFLENTLIRRGGTESIFSSHNRKTLVDRGPSEISKSIANALGYYDKGGARIYAQGIVDLLNYKRSSRRIDSLM